MNANAGSASLSCGVAEMATTTELSLPRHLTALPGQPWAIWRWACLRGAGFPAKLVLRLAAPDCARAADELLRAERNVAQCRRHALDAVRLELDRSRGQDEERRKPLIHALRQLNKGGFLTSGTGVPQEVCQNLVSAQCQWEDAQKAFAAEFENGVNHISKEIRDTAADPLFCQAALLQNSTAYRQVLRSLTGGSSQKRSKERQYERFIANHLQRYTVKNDTIGFFGPIGWAKVTKNTRCISVRPGPNLVAASSIYFENWPIEALAQRVLQDPWLLPWLPPRLLPTVRLDHEFAYPHGKAPVRLTPDQIEILKLCDGERCAKEIARALMGDARSGILSEQKVYETLLELVALKVLIWTAEIPFDVHPEKRLRRLLERAEDGESRRCALEWLAELDRSRNQVQHAFGNPQELDHAIQNLESTFATITGGPTSRCGGEMYAGRTLIYQDCRRDVDMEIGAGLLESIADPMSLVLTSARWFSRRTATLCRDVFRQIYTSLVQASAGAPVTFLSFWKNAQPILLDPHARIFNSVVAELQERWSKILRIPQGERRVTYTSRELRPHVDVAFDASRPGWQMARYHSPDVMIAASSVEAVRQGDCLFVLGEVHMTENTIRDSMWVSQHPHPGELFEAIRSDLPEPRLIPVPRRGWPRVTNRSRSALSSPGDYFLEFAGDSLHYGPREETIAAASLTIEDSERGLVARTSDRAVCIDLLESVGDLLSMLSCEFLKILPPARYQPRITIDKMVICREMWSFGPQELDFIHHAGESERFLAARRWAVENHLPRFVFAKSPLEVKPFYVDFDSPVYVEILVTMIRRLLAGDPSASMTITEMLPGPGQMWLPDHAGNVYACELRMIARDLSVQALGAPAVTA
jgi:hypothetical protein